MSGATRTAEASPTEEPGAGKPHAGICAGGVGEPASLPRRGQDSSPGWIIGIH